MITYRKRFPGFAKELDACTLLVNADQGNSSADIDGWLVYKTRT